MYGNERERAHGSTDMLTRPIATSPNGPEASPASVDFGPLDPLEWKSVELGSNMRSREGTNGLKHQLTWIHVSWFDG